MHRLFVAFRPPPPVCALLLDIMEGVEGARWQQEEQLHLTLRFIGEVERGIAEDVAAVLGSVHFEAFAARIAGVGSFDRKGEGKPIWAGLTPHEPLAALHRKIDSALIRAGLEPEHRAYHPHITVARFGRGKGDPAPWIARNATLSSPPFEIDHLALFESHIGKSGAHYEEVLRVAARDRRLSNRRP